MATRSVSVPWTLEQLLEAIKHLAPAERHELQRQFLAWQNENGTPEKNEEELLQAAAAHLSTTAERRLRRLISKSEQGTLTPKELNEYRSLAQQAEQVDVTRAAALAELIRRRSQHAPIVRAETGAEGDADGA